MFDRKIDLLDSKIVQNTDKIDRVENKIVQNKDSIGTVFDYYYQSQSMAFRITKDSHITEFKHSTDIIDKFKSINISNTKIEIRITNTDNGDCPGSSRNRSNKRPARG